MENVANGTWPLRRVGLKVKDFDLLTDFYQNLGLSIVRDERDNPSIREVGLGESEKEILTLRELKNGYERPNNSAGLYHFALLLSDESLLGAFLHHSINQRIPLEGAADHLVSQAIYLRDPEGNGIEIYADRPYDMWQWDDGTLVMGTEMLDIQALLKKGEGIKQFIGEVKLGHMHLNVGDLDKSQEFYKTLGMDLVIRIPNQVHFLSWGGYHHHLGVNVWEGKNAKKHDQNSYGLDFFEITHPSLSSQTLTDPDGIKIILNDAG